MKTLTQSTETGGLPVNWCNADAVTSSVMEAVSFVTPVLENFFIRTVAEGIRTPQHPELQERCRAFMHEESNHSRVHRKFNQSLLDSLGKQPPGLAMIGKLLDLASRHLPISKRLALAAALEHFAAVVSKLYVSHGSQLTFKSAFAKELFDMHAREELAHRCVVFDLWRTTGVSGSLHRIAVVLLASLACATYVGLAVPWILHQKTNRRLGKTLSGLFGFVAGNFVGTLTNTPVAELFSFVRKDFHPKHLIDDSQLAGV